MIQNKKGVADMSNPKNYGIALVLYLFFMLVLWKFQMGTSKIDLFPMKLIVSIAFLPACLGIVYAMGDD